MPLKLWSKLEDPGDVTSPQIGTGGAEVGTPSYLPARFGNGIYGQASKGCTFPTAANSISGSKGTLEFWIRPQFNSPGAAPTYRDIIYCVSTAQIRVWWQIDGGGRFKASFSNGSRYVEATGISFSAGDLLHIGVTWDETGTDIGGGKTIAIYVDNVEEDSIILTWTAGAIATDMRVGYRDGSYYSDMIVDNIKYYDVVKTDFSDKDNEGAGANTPPTAPTSLEVDGKSTPTGANCVTTTPEFSAIFNDPDAGDQSNAIEIQVGSASGLSDMWDSGWLADSTIDGNRCIAKIYAGAALSEGTSYWWRSRFRDDDGGEGAWSGWQQFDVCLAEEVGLLECAPGGPLPKRCPFRCAVALPRKVPSWLY